MSCHIKLLSMPDDHATKTAYRIACSNVQSRLREIQNKWWFDVAEKTYFYADIGNSKAFYETLRAIYGPTYQFQAPLRSSDGFRLLTDRVSILHYRTEYYFNHFGDRRSVQEASIDKIPQQDVKLELDNPPTEAEIKVAIA